MSATHSLPLQCICLSSRRVCSISLSNQARRWVLRQVVDDPEGDHEWAITAEVDLEASDEVGEAVLTVTGFGTLSEQLSGQTV